jgi:hypothetical protein
MPKTKIKQAINSGSPLIIIIEGRTKRELGKSNPLVKYTELTVTLRDEGSHYEATVIDGEHAGETFQTYPHQISRLASGVAAVASQSVGSEPKAKAKGKAKGKARAKVAVTARLTGQITQLPELSGPSQTDLVTRPYKLTYLLDKPPTPPRSKRAITRDAVKSRTGTPSSVVTRPLKGIRLKNPNLTRSGPVKPRDITDPHDYVTACLPGTVLFDTDRLVLGPETSQVKNYTNYSEDLFSVAGWQKLLSNGVLSEDYSYYLSGHRWDSVEQPAIILACYELPGLSSDLTTKCQTVFSDALADKLLTSEQLKLKYPIISHLQNWTTPLEQLDKAQLIKYLTDRGLEYDTVISTCKGINLANLTLRRLLYAKFIHNPSLQDLLLATRQAMIVTPVGDNVYQVGHSLMETRHYLQTGVQPVYYNTGWESEQQQLTIASNKYVEDLLQWVHSYGELPEAGVVSTTLSATQAQVVLANNQDKLESLLTSKPDVMGSSGETSPDIFSPGESEADSPLPLKLSDLLRDEQQYREFYVQQLKVIDQNLLPHKLLAYDVPPNGDCLFYAIMDVLTQTNHPWVSSEQASKTLRRISLSPFKTGVPVCVREEAVITLRQLLADKVVANSEKPYLDTGLTVRQIVAQELREELGESVFSELSDPFASYTERIQKSASSDNVTSEDQHHGIWGGDTEIWMTCAYFGINIQKWVISQTSVFVKSELYLADRARQYFPDGDTSDPDTPTPTLNLIWVSLGTQNQAHFITTRPTDSELVFWVNDDGQVRKAITVTCSDATGNTLEIGTGFNPETGIFTPSSGPIEPTITPLCSPTNLEWNQVKYYRVRDEVYYRGCLVGSFSEDVIPIVFTS